MRVNETESFPISPTCPITLITYKDKCINTKVYQLRSQSSKYEFLADTAKLKGKYKLIGCWVGQWRSDMFELNVDIIRDKVKNNL